MSKHTAYKYSQTELKRQNNKAGATPQAPTAGTNAQNQYK